MTAQPDPALADAANAASAVLSLSRLEQENTTLALSPEGAELRRLIPVVARRAIAAARGVFQPPKVIFVEVPTPALPAPDPYEGMTLRDARRIWECEFLTRRLADLKGNLAATAEAIGMERSAFTRKCADLGVAVDRQPGRVRRLAGRAA